MKIAFFVTLVLAKRNSEVCIFFANVVFGHDKPCTNFLLGFIA